jgi:hypothetical protein
MLYLFTYITNWHNFIVARRLLVKMVLANFMAPEIH